MLPSASYNERSWAIDLIGHLKKLAHQVNRPVKDAGGENTVRSEGGVLFPDVLLYGDRETARILQGWELKFPDTDIDDYEFRKNAEKCGKEGQGPWAGQLCAVECVDCASVHESS